MAHAIKLLLAVLSAARKQISQKSSSCSAAVFTPTAAATSQHKQG
jgi:hypothetical protein